MPPASSASYAATMFGWPSLAAASTSAWKPGYRQSVLHHGLRQHLDRHHAPYGVTLGLKDLSHPTGADLVEDGISAQDQ